MYCTVCGMSRWYVCNVQYVVCLGGMQVQYTVGGMSRWYACTVQ